MSKKTVIKAFCSITVVGYCVCAWPEESCKSQLSMSCVYLCGYLGSMLRFLGNVLHNNTSNERVHLFCGGLDGRRAKGT